MSQENQQQTQQTQQTQQPQQQPTIIIQNTNTNVNSNVGHGKEKNKWITLVLWFFFGLVGGHKFYEGKVGMGILYLLTGGLFGIGTFIDFFVILFKPTHYYV